MSAFRTAVMERAIRPAKIATPARRIAGATTARPAIPRREHATRIAETGEDCDDGNNGDGDGCSSTCAVARVAQFANSNVRGGSAIPVLLQKSSLHFRGVIQRVHRWTIGVRWRIL
ncbi:MAG: hypothetical protein IH987_03910 [Planctomycetes bacterium]|nr:hypothetical protein [Planctomycetota bacterium]